MVTIKGYEFNMTQVGHNKYINHITSGKEAQKLAELIRGLDEEVTIINKSADGRIGESLTFNRKEISLNPNRDYVEFEYQEEVTADSAFLENWCKSTGATIHHGVTFSASSDINTAINSATINSSSIMHTTQITQGSTKYASVKDPFVKGMGQSEFLSYVRENGLDKEINWNEASEYLKADAKFSTVSDFTSYAGAMYASLEQRIMKDFSGDEQAAQIKQLNDCFNTAVQNYADSYTDKITGVYGEFDVSVDEFVLKASVTNLFAEKRDSYREYVTQNTDYAGLNENEDKWLERDIKFMTNALRKSHNPAENISSSLYGENDLKVLGYMANQHYSDSVATGMGYVGSSFTEESIGVALSLKYLSAEAVTEKWNASDEVRGIVSALADSYVRRLTDKADDYITAMGKEHDSTEEYAPLDRSVIADIISRAKSVYGKSGDTAKALKECADYAYRLYAENKADSAKSGYARYNIPTDEPELNFWHEFYDDGRGTSYLGKTVDKLCSLESAVENDNYSFLDTVSNSFFFRYETLLGGLYNKYLV